MKKSGIKCSLPWSNNCNVLVDASGQNLVGNLADSRNRISLNIYVFQFSRVLVADKSQAITLEAVVVNVLAANERNACCLINFAASARRSSAANFFAGKAKTNCLPPAHFRPSFLPGAGGQAADAAPASIPKGLCPPAQGCEARATLGNGRKTETTPTGLCLFAYRTAVGAQPRWGIPNRWRVTVGA